MWTSGRTCMLTQFCLEAPPCTPALLTVCRRRSLPHQRGSTQYGLEDPSWHLFPPSNRCGLASRNMTSLAHQLSTESASKKQCSSFYFCATLFIPKLTKICMLIGLLLTPIGNWQ